MTSKIRLIPPCPHYARRAEFTQSNIHLFGSISRMTINWEIVIEFGISDAAYYTSQNAAVHINAAPTHGLNWEYISVSATASSA